MNWIKFKNLPSNFRLILILLIVSFYLGLPNLTDRVFCLSVRLTVDISFTDINNYGLSNYAI